MYCRSRWCFISFRRLSRLHICYYSSSVQAVATHGEEEAAAADQATAAEEGADSVVSSVAGRWFGFVAAHSHTDAESSSGVEKSRGVACIAAGTYHTGQSSESAGGDDVVQSVDGAATGVPDKTALAPAAIQSATEHVRDLLDTAATLPSGVAW